MLGPGRRSAAEAFGKVVAVGLQQPAFGRNHGLERLLAYGCRQLDAFFARPPAPGHDAAGIGIDEGPAGFEADVAGKVALQADDVDDEVVGSRDVGVLRGQDRDPAAEQGPGKALSQHSGNAFVEGFAPHVELGYVEHGAVGAAQHDGLGVEVGRQGDAADGQRGARQAFGGQGLGLAVEDVVAGGHALPAAGERQGEGEGEKGTDAH